MEKKFTLAQLTAMPTLVQGQHDDLKVDIWDTDGRGMRYGRRVWLSRLTKEDGEYDDHLVTVETWTGNRWAVLASYPAIV